MRLIDANKLKKHPLIPLGVIHLIDSQPSIEAEPVVHGHWKKFDDSGRELAIPYCSHCLHLPLRDNGYAIKLSSFCPNCGAKMDEEVK